MDLFGPAPTQRAHIGFAMELFVMMFVFVWS